MNFKTIKTPNLEHFFFSLWSISYRPDILWSFFQGSQGSLGNGGYELQNNQDPESGAGPESMGGKGGQTGEDSIKTRPDSSAASQVPPRFNGMFGLFMGLFGKQGKEDTTAR